MPATDQNNGSNSPTVTRQSEQPRVGGRLRAIQDTKMSSDKIKVCAAAPASPPLLDPTTCTLSTTTKPQMPLHKNSSALQTCHHDLLASQNHPQFKLMKAFSGGDPGAAFQPTGIVPRNCKGGHHPLPLADHPGQHGREEEGEDIHL